MKRATQEERNEARLSAARINSAKGRNVIEKEDNTGQIILGTIIFLILLLIAGTTIYLIIDAAREAYQGALCTRWSLECIRLWTGW